MAALYLMEQGAVVRKVDQRVVVELEGRTVQDIPLIKIDQVVIFGRVTVTAAATAMFLEHGIEVVYLTAYGKFLGRLQPPAPKNCLLRVAQYRASLDGAASAWLARCFVRGKIKNMLYVLQRSRREGAAIDEIFIQEIKKALKALEGAADVDAVRGVEGVASAVYFKAFGEMIKKDFSFAGRVKRPPTDPVNSLLSLGYTLLAKDMTSAVNTVGLDPYMGFLHRQRYGRTSLALDLMEEFRPVIVDTLVLACLNKGIIKPDDFSQEIGGAVYLKDEARKKFLVQYETKKNSEIRHPVFNYQASYRRCMDLQARLLAKCLTGEIEEYPPLVWR
ncbi:MAG: type I-D CRISPR-associated endonuclease Cas1d [Desulfurispora sp.]|uniref:type I-D CRISPR-associated endonuclease Cas1d n=1 Tax=Desulfurispora sp. TaxID=3014275 RepID=UPI00404AFBC3